MAMNDDKKLRDTYLKQYSDGIEETRLSCSKAANAEFLVTLYYISKYLHPGVRVIDIGAGVGSYVKELSHKGYMINANLLVI
jgi:SAM-dependent methyltransferase